MKHLSRFSILFAAVMLGFVGIGFFKDFFRDFSIIDFSFSSIIVSFLGGSFFLTSAFYMGLLAFKRMRNL